jgi:ATP-dependent RNA helicase DDX55/SPB4
MRNPVVVDVAVSAVQKKSEAEAVDSSRGDGKQQATPSTLTNYYIISSLDEKLSRLLAFLHQHSNEKIIIFFLTCACVEYYSAILKELNLPCKGFEYEALHGKLVQKRREKAMERFRERKGSTALLCTDVAARGLDVPDVSWTIQFDAPVDPSSYVHRVGRSARAGKVGNSLVFLTRKEDAYVDFLKLRKVPVRELPDTEVCRPPSIEDDEEEQTSDNKQSADDASEGAEEQRIIKSSVSGGNIVDVLPKIRSMCLKDRDILEKGTKAYTS